MKIFVINNFITMHICFPIRLDTYVLWRFIKPFNKLLLSYLIGDDINHPAINNLLLNNILFS